MVEKSYSYLKASRSILELLGWLALFFFFALSYGFISPSLVFMRVWYLMLGVLCLGGAAYTFVRMVLGVNIKEISVSERGIFFRRRFRPFTIQNIHEIKEHKPMLRKKDVAITITGLTPEGRRTRVTIRRQGDVGKRWEEFKKDVRETMKPS